MQVAASVAKGGDPQRDKMVERAATVTPVRTMKAIVDEFLKRHTNEKSGKRWAAETRRILNRDVLPAIGDMAATAVGKAEIHDLLDPIMDRGAPIAANRTLAVVKKLYRWALSRGYVERDPCAGIVKPGLEGGNEARYRRSCPTTSLRASGGLRRAWPIRSVLL